MREKKKIVLFYAWGTSNAGDHALCLGALELLLAIVSADEIVVVSRYGPGCTSGEPSDDIRKCFPGVKVVPGPFRFSRSNLLQKLLQNAHGFVVAVSGMILPRMLLGPLRNYEAIRELEGARMVLLNGGNLFYWHHVRRAPGRLIAFAFPLVMARRSSIPYGILPGTSGPFEGVASRLIARLFQNARFALFRDSKSLENVAEIADLSNVQTAVLPDLAFFLSERDGATRDVLGRCGYQSGEYLAVVLRVVPLGEDVSPANDDPLETESALMRFLPRVLFHVQKRTGKKILIVEQADDDVGISRLVEEELLHLECSVKFLRLRDPYEFVGLYANAAALLSMRLHSMIFSLGQGTPVVGLWREELGPKIPSMMRDLGLSEYAFELKSVDPVAIEEAVVRAIERREVLREQINRRVAVGKADLQEFLAPVLSE